MKYYYFDKVISLDNCKFYTILNLFYLFSVLFLICYTIIFIVALPIKRRFKLLLRQSDHWTLYLFLRIRRIRHLLFKLFLQMRFILSVHIFICLKIIRLSILNKAKSFLWLLQFTRFLLGLFLSFWLKFLVELLLFIILHHPLYRLTNNNWFLLLAYGNIWIWQHINAL